MRKNHWKKKITYSLIFDGNSEIRDDLMELISCCVECNNVISVDHAQGNKGQTNVVYYIQDEKSS